MKLLSSRLYFQLVTPRQIGPASCQNFSRIQVYCLCIQYTDSLNHIMILCYTWKEVDHTQYKDLWHQVFVPYFHLYFFGAYYQSIGSNRLDKSSCCSKLEDVVENRISLEIIVRFQNIFSSFVCYNCDMRMVNMFTSIFS